MTTECQEKRRVEIQAACDAAKEQAERNRLGQFATPPHLALEIVRYAIGLLSAEEQIRFLDPAVGTGAFFSALLNSVQPRRIKRATGFEIDSAYGAPACQLWGGKGLEVRLEDFTRAHPPNDKSERFNLVVCNPPYVRHHHLSGEDKMRLRGILQRACGAHINGLAGLYCYFVGLTHPWMAMDAVAAWLIPSEFMDVNYGLPLKDYLLSRVTLLRIHRFDPNDVQFGDALVSSAIVWVRNRPPTPDHMVELTYGGSLSKPRRSRVMSGRDLRQEPKWTRLTSPHRAKNDGGVVLADLFTTKRGIATGANSFFVLTPEQIRELGLPKRFLVPVLPSPRYLPCDEVFGDEEGNPILQRVQFLLDCRLAEEEVKDRFPRLWSYLQQGRSAGLADRYLCAGRSPWYAQESRAPCRFLCTYIGRSDTKTGRPFRFILNHSRATAANVYLLLYPRPELERALAQRPQLAREIWEKLNAIDSKTMIGEGRVYGGGLHKLEPKELANVPADEIGSLVAASYSPKAQQMVLLDRKRKTAR